MSTDIDHYDPIFNISEADQAVAKFLTPWTPSEVRDLVIIPMLAVSFVWTCGMLYLLFKWRSSPLNAMWPCRALLVVVAFCWQACFALSTGRAHRSISSELRVTSQEQCRLFIFVNFAVFEPWFCLVLMFSLKIQWPECITRVLSCLLACSSCSRSTEQGPRAHVRAAACEADGEAAAAGFGVCAEGAGGGADLVPQDAGPAARQEVAKGGEGGGGGGGGVALRDGGKYYLMPRFGCMASVVLLVPSIFFHLAWYRVVVLGKEWDPMRLQVGGPCATWFGHLLGTAVYIAGTVFFLHTNGRTLTSLAINRQVQRRLFWLRVNTSGLLIASFVLRFITVFYQDLTAGTNNALFISYFLVVVVVGTHSTITLVLRPLLGIPQMPHKTRVH